MSPVQGQWLETAALNAWSWDTTISTSPMLLLTLTRGGAAATPLFRGIWTQIHTGKGSQSPCHHPKEGPFHRSAIQ